MGDLQYDPSLRDLVITNGDFTEIDNPSVQNGAIIRDAHCFSLQNPIYGIGLQRVINEPVATINYEMNRWVSQVKSDGATSADFTITGPDQNKKVTVNNTISYV